MKRAEGVEAVNRSEKITFRGEIQLPAKYIDLFLKWRATKTGEARIVRSGALEHPAIEPDFADAGFWCFAEAIKQCLLPIRRAVADVPWVDAKAWEEVKRFGIAGRCLCTSRGRAKSRYFGPILFVGSIDDAATNSRRCEIGQDARMVRREPRVVQVVMCVEELEHRNESIRSARERAAYGWGIRVGELST